MRSAVPDRIRIPHTLWQGFKRVARSTEYPGSAKAIRWPDRDERGPALPADGRVVGTRHDRKSSRV